MRVVVPEHDDDEKEHMLHGLTTLACTESEIEDQAVS
jgi:hypothetical protein